MTFYMIVGKEKLFLFDKAGPSCNRLYIEGNPDFLYDANQAEHDKKKDDDKKNLFITLIKEYNLDTHAELDFKVIYNEDPIRSQVMKDVLGEHVSGQYEILDIVHGIAKSFTKDTKLMIDEFGINFDGKNYMVRDNDIVKQDYSLLGYTLREEQIMRFLG